MAVDAREHEAETGVQLDLDRLVDGVAQRRPCARDRAAPRIGLRTAGTAVCASRRVITLHPNLPAGNKLRTAALEITGQETRRLNRWANEVTVDLRGVRLRLVTVRIKARTNTGKLFTDTRVYKTCGRPG
jgi:hypothetical protein